MISVKDLTGGVAGDGLSCARNGGDELSGDSENKQTVVEGKGNVLFCSL